MDKLNEALLDLLKNIAEKENYANCKISVEQISSGGANYSSYIFLATISSEEKKDLKLFAKVAAMGDKIRKFTDQIYKTELFFYTYFINSYRQLEETHRVPEEHKLRIAKYYGSFTKSNHEILVLEDLTASGFQSFDRFKGVTWDQTVECIAQLAKFHALSFALFKRSPGEFAEAKENFSFNQIVQFYLKFIKNIRVKVIEATEDRHKQRIDNFITNTLNSENFRYFYQPIKKEVLIHGDYRPNNLMYKYKDGACQVVLLDLQTIHCGSPLFDLLYFIDFGFGDDFRKTHFRATVDYYYTELCAALRRLKLDPNEIISREDFDYELKETLPFTVLFGLCGLLVLTVDEDDAPRELGDMGPEDFAFPPNDRYRERLKEYISFYSEMDVIPL